MIIQPDPSDLAALRPLLAEMNDLKRVRTALSDPAATLAAGRFFSSWTRLLAGDDAETIACQEAAAAVAGARLAGIDARVLTDAGLDDDAAGGVLRRSIAQWSDALPEPLPRVLAAAAGDLPAADEDSAERLRILFEMEDPPGFVEVLDRLADAPRAGATRPGRARLILTPEESHADHCYLVAVYAVLLAPLYDADTATVFLAGLSHHLHNAYLPDAGFTGEDLLGDHLAPVVDAFTDRALAELPDDLAEQVRAARACLPDADTPEGRAFHAADVLDRVLQMAHFERAAAFTAKQALEDLDLVHPGPVRDFHVGVLRGAGLWD